MTVLMKKKTLFIVLFFAAAVATGVLRALPYNVEREAFVTTAAEGEVVLEKGIYSVRANYSENNYSVLVLEPEETDAVRTGFLFLLPEAQTVTGRIYVDGPSANVHFFVSAAYSDSDIRMEEIIFAYRRFATMCYAFLRTLFLFAFAYALFLFGRKWVVCGDRTTRLVMACCLLLVIGLSLPLFRDHLIGGHDTRFHIHRIEAVGEGMRNGYFPVYLYTGWFHDFGYPLGVYYGNLYLYPFALLYEAGFPLWSCFRALLICVNAATVFISYRCFRRISGNPLTGLFCCLLYSGAVWYLSSIYTSNTPGASLAMAFLPLIVTGFYDLIREEYREGVRFLIAGFTGVIQTHVITLMMSVLFATLFCLLHWRIFTRPARIKSILKAAACTAAVNLGFLVPFLDYMNRYRDIGAYHYYADSIQENGVTFPQLFSPVYNVRGLIRYQTMPDGASEMPQTAGIALWCVFALALVLLIRYRRSLRIVPYIRSLLLLSLLSIFMTTMYFPYRWIMQHLPAVYAVIAKSIQFQARYLAVSCVLLCTLAALCMPVLTERFGQSKTGYLICAGIALLSLIQSGVFIGQYIATDDPASTFVAYTGANYDGYTDNLYVKSGADMMVKNTAVEDAGHLVEVGDVRRSGFSFTGEIRNPTGETQLLAFPVWAYYGYRAYGLAGGTKEMWDVVENPVFRASVPVPAGFEGEVQLEWQKPLYWLLAEITSVSAVAVLLYRGRAREKSNADAA
ncbi:MAG: hypothetical protein IJR00_03100 [Lachnospiraceae bacterium]|nr:hypothetical protein [Lachnospiraceae bacterium]